MKKVTEQSLKTAFSNESQDNMRYLLFAEKAKEEGFNNLARLFQSIAYAERVHAKKYLQCLNDISSSQENLQTALTSEKFQIEELFPSFFQVAGLQNEVEAQIGFNCSLETEQVHAMLFSRALENVQQGKDIILGNIHICKSCGYTLEGEPPPTCPVCGLARDTFKSF
ncbi:MAG: rubrerythrin family protein [Candidatus Xenobiia bacterium LiM19]